MGFFISIAAAIEANGAYPGIEPKLPRLDR
jgi:hypothetical protein